jgi:hypothetical protein
VDDGDALDLARRFEDGVALREQQNLLALRDRSEMADRGGEPAFVGVRQGIIEQQRHVLVGIAIAERLRRRSERWSCSCVPADSSPMARVTVSPAAWTRSEKSLGSIDTLV